MSSQQVPTAGCTTELVNKLTTQLNSSNPDQKLEFLQYLLAHETQFDVIMMYHRFLREDGHSSERQPLPKVVYPRNS